MSIDNNLPREQILQFGPGQLSNSDLLAVIFSKGSRKENVFDLARRTISEYGVNYLVEIRSFAQLQSLIKLPKLKALQLLAVLELGRRIYSNNYGRRLRFDSPKKVAEEFAFLRHKTQEELWVIFTDPQQRVQGQVMIALGRQNVVAVDVSQVFRLALEYQASGIILVHNHPSGFQNPSQEDIELTKRMSLGAEILGIRVLDHIIIGESEFSFLEAGLVRPSS